MTHSSRNQRRYFRLAYPLSDRPSLNLNGSSFEVSELSEQGLRFYHRNAIENYQSGDDLEGLLEFRDGHVVPVSGNVGRLTDVDVVVVKLTGVTFARMVKEQRHLIRKYGNFMKN